MPGNKVVCRTLLLLGLTISFAPRDGLAVPILSIEPPSLLVQLGKSFSLDVRISGVADLFAFQFDLAFNPFFLSAGSITEGPFLPSGGTTSFIPGTVDNTLGTITATADTLIGAIPGVNGSGVLASVDFQALGVGNSPITLSNVILLNSDINDIPVSIVDASITVTPISEPSGWLLLSTAGFALLIWRWGWWKKLGIRAPWSS